MTRRLWPALLLLALALLPAAAWAQPRRAVSALDHLVAVEWEVGRDSRGGPLIFGYAYNDHRRHVTNMRLFVETLDADGKTVAGKVGYVDQPVPQFGRAYFEVRPPAPGAGYRVSITGFDFRGGGGP